ncbi:hypothetical protein [Burkholderia savannae]|uniref:hypothetical protein n=1 Tax=Burkholderia savannae TaxID=1637837 RepID=UPI000A7BA1F6|nr:hypothetical protein [Burkholderia savannae]
MKRQSVRWCAGAIAAFIWLVTLRLAIDGLSARLAHAGRAWPSWPWDANGTGVFVNGVVAVGTFAAAAVALWVALSERRNRTHGEVVAARLTAGGASPKIQTAIRKTGRASVAVDGALIILEPDSRNEVGDLSDSVRAARQALRSLESIPFCSFDEIRSMSPLPDNCALQIEAAQGRLNAAISFLKEVRNGHKDLQESLAIANQVDHDFELDDVKSDARALMLSIEVSSQSMLFENAQESLREAEKLLNNALLICENQGTAIDEVLWNIKLEGQ